MIACELIAKFRFFGCFPLQHFTCFILSVGTQTALYEFRGGKISAISEEFCSKRARGTSQSRPGGVSCLLPVAGRMRCCCMARDGRYLVGGLGDVEATLSGTSVLPEKI